MNNRLRLLLLCLLIALTTMVLLFYRKEPVRIAGCPGSNIDMTKMLQYGEKVQGIRLYDRYNQAFDLTKYREKPILFVFIKDNFSNIQTYHDSLYRHLDIFINRGLEIVFINSGITNESSNLLNPKGITLFYDTDSSAFFNAFKVYKHSSCIILNKNHQVILSTVTALMPLELEKIVRYKEAKIFE